MDPVSQLVGAMEAPRGPGVATGYVVTIIGKGLAGREPRCLADNLVALDHQAAAIGVLDDPFAAEEGDGVVGAVPDGDEINERVRLIDGQGGSAMMIMELIEPGGEAGQFAGTGHNA